MSLLMIVYDFPPAVTAGVYRALRFAKYLGETGCRPSVLTCNTGIEPGGNELLAQLPADVIVHRVGEKKMARVELPEDQPKGESSPDNGSARWLPRTVKSLLRPGWQLISESPDQYIGWARKAGRFAAGLCDGGQFDAIYTTGPPHSSHLAGYYVSQKLGLPWIADFRDPWARHNWGKSRNPWGRQFLPRFERKVVRCATRVVLNNETAREEFRQFYSDLPAEKFVAVPNGFDPDLLTEISRIRRVCPNKPVEDIRSKRLPVICHPGSLYRQREPRSLLQAIQQLKQEGLAVRFQQIGYAASENDPLRIGKELGIEDLVEVIPKIPHAEVLERMSRADVLLMIQPDAPLQVPGKLYEMLLFDTPIVAVCDSAATSSIIQSDNRCWQASSSDVPMIAKAIRLALEIPHHVDLSDRERLREEYNGRKLTRDLRDIVASMIDAFQGPEHDAVNPKMKQAESKK